MAASKVFQSRGWKKARSNQRDSPDPSGSSFGRVLYPLARDEEVSHFQHERAAAAEDDRAARDGKARRARQEAAACMAGHRRSSLCRYGYSGQLRAAFLAAVVSVSGQHVGRAMMAGVSSE